MKALLSKRQDVVLLIVGGGPARGSLEQLAKELGIERSVRFAGMVNPNEVADYYKLETFLHVRRQARHRG